MRVSPKSLAIGLTASLCVLATASEVRALVVTGVVNITAGNPGGSALVTGLTISAPAQTVFKLKLKNPGGAAGANLTLHAGLPGEIGPLRSRCGTPLSAPVAAGKEDGVIVSGDRLAGRHLCVGATRAGAGTAATSVAFEVTIE